MKCPWFQCVVAAAVMIGLAGCKPSGQIRPSSRPPEAPKPVSRIDAIELTAMPTALNFDNIPGPDGIQVRIFCYQLNTPTAVLVSGTMEVLMFEGNVPPEGLGAKPFHIWKFTGEELSAYRQPSMVGWGYGLQLLWGTHMPTAPMVTVAARYTPPGGQPIYALPVSIAVAAK